MVRPETVDGACRDQSLNRTGTESEEETFYPYYYYGRSISRICVIPSNRVTVHGLISELFTVEGGSTCRRVLLYVGWTTLRTTLHRWVYVWGLLRRRISSSWRVRKRLQFLLKDLFLFTFL